MDILEKLKADIYNIDSIKIRTVTPTELLDLELEKNGKIECAEAVFSVTLRNNLRKAIKDFKRQIIDRLPDPKLTTDDLRLYKSDYKDIESIKNWKPYCLYDSNFSLQSFDDDGDAVVKWTFKIWKNREDTITSTTHIIKLSKIINVFEKLLNLPKPKNAWKSFWADYSYKDIQNKLLPIYNEYMESKNKITQRILCQTEFLKSYEEKRILVIDFKDGTYYKYLEEYCGFDIVKTFDAINKEFQENQKAEERHQKKLINSYDDGEKNVEYAIEWFVKSNKNMHIVPIKSDCESKYRYGCILLNKPDYIDDPQEYDHILVCSSGIIVIETKHWKGTVEIRDDGKWIRENEESTYGIASPKLQINRHERMLEKIVPNIKIYSLLCFSNGKVIINGKENFTEYPIITIDQLEEYLGEICSSNLYNDEEVDSIVDIINEHKVDIKN